jgi:hypothetical protein
MLRLRTPTPSHYAFSRYVLVQISPPSIQGIETSVSPLASANHLSCLRLSNFTCLNEKLMFHLQRNESLLTVRDSEIKAERYILPEELRRIEEERRAEEERQR